MDGNWVGCLSGHIMTMFQYFLPIRILPPFIDLSSDATFTLYYFGDVSESGITKVKVRQFQFLSFLSKI